MSERNLYQFSVRCGCGASMDKELYGSDLSHKQAKELAEKFWNEHRCIGAQAQQATNDLGEG